MDSIDSPFTIEIDGKPIANVGDSSHLPVQAALGSNAAVFTLKDNRLKSGDWVLARNITEDRSFLPKQVLWFKAGADSDKQVHPVTAQKVADGYQIKFANASLIAEDGNVFADLMGGE
ncbi:uncharacterized protein K460DRAFT_273010 [Cucurbitaria berberidis CBS 394.84]|uniref:Uncharacterized protein n=1 Tax=Cucurbitaria berberidis CBS 394.84 TaxID=1168544 RepID=A0A9P4GWC3_9PLEO|nr:uncharacterized protein K460DRAFT_273010 [Cucurbitaria berberidis CBS 394.84]KAF1852221.1 hypothetical protein K460DRAFT_273010 [Cucurbitaria berberidis CBS 394.84]